jgi:uncharacterized protein (TIGR02300 family)
MANTAACAIDSAVSTSQVKHRFSKPPGTSDVAKPELGIKRLCAGCGAKFYDLSKSPIVCPKCSTVYEITLPRGKSDGPRAVAPVAEAEPEAVEVETVPLEEADAETTGRVKADVPESVDDIETDETIEDDDDDSTFIAEEEESEDDVTDIIGDVTDDEET